MVFLRFLQRRVYFQDEFQITFLLGFQNVPPRHFLKVFQKGLWRIENFQESFQRLFLRCFCRIFLRFFHGTKCFQEGFQRWFWRDFLMVFHRGIRRFFLKSYWRIFVALC